MAIDPALQKRLMAAAPYGMGVAVHADEAPDRMAVLSKYGGRTLGELNANANRLARVLRAHGVGPDVGVALLCRNRPEFVETVAACQRSGGRMTPINWHISPPRGRLHRRELRSAGADRGRGLRTGPLPWRKPSRATCA